MGWPSACRPPTCSYRRAMARRRGTDPALAEKLGSSEAARRKEALAQVERMSTNELGTKAILAALADLLDREKVAARRLQVAQQLVRLSRRGEPRREVVALLAAELDRRRGYYPRKEAIDWLQLAVKRGWPAEPAVPALARALRTPCLRDSFAVLKTAATKGTDILDAGEDGTLREVLSLIFEVGDDLNDFKAALLCVVAIIKSGKPVGDLLDVLQWRLEQGTLPGMKGTVEQLLASHQ